MFTCMFKPLSWHLKKKNKYQLLTIPEFFDHTKFSFWGRMFSFIWLKFHCTLDHEPPNENMRNSNTLKCNLWTLLHHSQHCLTSFVLLWDKVHTNNYLCFFGNKLKYKTQAWGVYFFYIHLLSFLCHCSSPSRHLTKVLPKYLLIAKHPSAALFTLFFCGAGYARSLIKELQNNVNAQDITWCHFKVQFGTNAFLSFISHLWWRVPPIQPSVFCLCHLHVCVHFSILVWRTRYYTKGHFFGCMSAM